MQIYLIGMMGAGKSFLGEKLAANIDRNFIDLDLFIEEGMGMSIRDIFISGGEKYFRSIENKFLIKTQDHENSVIACGGGTILNPANRKFIHQTGVSIYLVASLSVLKRRLEKQTEHRPLLDVKNLKISLLNRFLNRAADYETSDFIVDADNDMNIVVREIKDCINDNFLNTTR